MSTPRAVVLEVWSDLQCASGTALGLVPDALSVSETRQIMGEDRLEVALPRNSSAWSLLRERRVLRATFSDATFDEWRVSELTEVREAEGGLRSLVIGRGPEQDLATLAPIGRTEADGSITYDFEAVGLTISDHLNNYILPALTGAGATWYASGTIDSSAPVDLVYSWTTPLQAALQLAQALRLEFRLRRNGTSQYLLDFLTQIGSSAGRLYLQSGKNLLSAQRQRSAVDMATRIYGRGTPEEGLYPTIADALWKVATAPTTTSLTLADPNGGDGPILEDNQLDLLYLRKWPAGSWVQVSSSFLPGQSVNTGSAHGCVANDLVQFATSSAGGALTSLHSPSAAAIYGTTHKILDRPDLPGTVNLIANPAMRTYTTSTNAAPDGWQVIPGCGLSVNNVDKETTATRWRSGGASAKVVAGGDGQGIETGWASITPTDAKPYFSGYMGFWLDTDGAKVRVDLVAGKATVSVSSMSRATSGSVTTVTVNTGSAHGLAIGDEVEILGVTGGTTADGYNGIRIVTRVVDTDTIEYQLTSDPGTVTLSSATLRPVWRFTATASPGSKFWNDLGWANEDLKQRSATVVKLRVMQDGSTAATLYVDRAQVTQGTGEGQRAFIEGSGPTQLWQAINRRLAEIALPATSYDAGLVDLGRAYPGTYTAEDVTLGGPVDLHDPEWGLAVSTRVLEVSRDLLVDGRTRVTLSNRPADVLDALVRPPRGNRLVPLKPTGRRLRRILRYYGGDFVPINSTSASVIDSTPGSNTGMSVTGAAAGAATVSVASGPEFLNATIRGFRFKMTNTGAGNVSFTLYRGTTAVRAMVVSASGTYGAANLTELGNAGTFLFWCELAPGVANTATLEWAEADIEYDEVAPA